MSWHRHPGVRSGDQLTAGERAADAMRNGMGSWTFIFGAIGFLLGWMATDGLGIDVRPWIILNLLLSCLAALQGGILLIAAKRADKIASELASHDYAVNCEALALLKSTNELVAYLRTNSPTDE